MTATAANVEFILREFRIVKTDVPSVTTKYGSSARRTDVVPTYFETEADAQDMCNERSALLSADRRRFQHSVSDEQTGLALTYATTTPTVTVIDDNRQANHTALISEITIDFAKQETRLETWG